MQAVSAPTTRLRPGLTAAAVYVVVGTANLLLAGLCAAQAATDPVLAVRGLYAASLVWAAVGLWSWHRTTGRVLDAYTLPAMTVWLFNGGGMALTGLLVKDPLAVYETFRLPVVRHFSDARLIDAFLLVLYCLSAMHLGALLGVSRQPAPAPYAPGVAAEKDSRLWWIGAFLIVVSIGPAFVMLRVSLGLVREGGYMALYRINPDVPDVNPLLFMLASGLVPGAFYLMGADLDNRRWRWIGRGLIVAFSTGMLALGTRAAFFQNVAAIFWLHHTGVRPIRRTTWAVLFFAGLALSTLIFWARMAPGDFALSRESLARASEQVTRDAAEPLNEMGSTIVTVAYVLDLVPAERDFLWGESYVYSLASVLPGGLAGGYFANRGTEEDWLVEVTSPATAATGGGFGFSIIAEAYVNFGTGAPVVLGLAGLVLGAFAGWSHAAGRSGRLAFAACVISMVLFSARASSLSFVRRTIVLVVVPYVVLVCGRMLEARLRGTTRGGSPFDGIRP